MNDNEDTDGVDEVRRRLDGVREQLKPGRHPRRRLVGSHPLESRHLGWCCRIDRGRALDPTWAVAVSSYVEVVC